MKATSCWLLLLLRLLLHSAGEASAKLAYSGHICAYLDANFDQLTDLLVVNATHVSIRIARLHDNIADSVSTIGKEPLETFEEPSPAWAVRLPKGLEPARIINCAVAALNADARPDLLLTTAEKSGTKTFACLGQPVGTEANSLLLNCSASGWELGKGHQPVLIDEDGDGRADVFLPESRKCLHWQGEEAEPVTKSCFVSEATAAPNFVHSILADRAAAPVFAIGVGSDEKASVELWDRQGTEWKRREKDWLPFNVEAKELLTSDNLRRGYEVVADLGASGDAHLILPRCKTKDCDTINLYVSPALDSGEETSKLYSLDLPKNGGPAKIVTEADGRFRLRSGDYDQDGYPDFLLLLGAESEGLASNLSVYYNRPCKSDSDDCPKGGPMSGRVFREEKDRSNILLPAEAKAGERDLAAAHFFDLGEDGSLDLVVELGRRDKRPRFAFLPDSSKGDVSFLKVHLQAPVCPTPHSRCLGAKSHEASGITLPGAVARFRMPNNEVGSSISDLSAVGVEMGQSSHGALDLPFLLFGLGQTPGYVESLELKVWSAEKGPPALQAKRLDLIVPNTRLYAVPPHDSVGSWVCRLFLTPSKLLFLSALGLAAVCAFCLIVVMALHCRERQQDKALQRAALHFDAM